MDMLTSIFSSPFKSRDVPATLERPAPAKSSEVTQASPSRKHAGGFKEPKQRITSVVEKLAAAVTGIVESPMCAASEPLGDNEDDRQTSASKTPKSLKTWKAPRKSKAASRTPAQSARPSRVSKTPSRTPSKPLATRSPRTPGSASNAVAAAEAKAPTTTASKTSRTPSGKAVANKTPPSESKARKSDVTAATIANNAAKSTEDDAYDLVRFADYRWDDDSINIKVEWAKGVPTWEPEINLHTNAPQELFAFWKSQGGRPANPRDAGLYGVQSIKKHSADRNKLLVEWTGFRLKDATWEPRIAIEKSARDLVADYFKAVDARSDSKKRRTRKTQRRQKRR